jgi:hypothetical protein
MTGLAKAVTGVVALALLVAWPAAAQPVGSLEYPVKANYLVKFTAFVQWPPAAFESNASPMAVCVLGEDPFGPVLDRAAAAEVAGGRRVVVRRLNRVDARSGCQVIYLGKSREQSVPQALAALAGAPVLTVTDSVRGDQRGVIHFAVADNRVRFHIDDQAAARSHLAISSRLLSLALSVRARRSA